MFSQRLSASGDHINDADHVISALPAHALVSALRQPQEGGRASDQSRGLKKLAGLLERINWVDVAVVHVEYDGEPQENLEMLGFGHLVPAVEKSNILGIIYDSCSFPEHDR